MAAAQPARPAAQREAGDADGAGEPEHRREPVRARRAGRVRRLHAGLDPGQARAGSTDTPRSPDVLSSTVSSSGPSASAP